MNYLTRSISNPSLRSAAKELIYSRVLMEELVIIRGYKTQAKGHGATHLIKLNQHSRKLLSFEI